MRTRIALVAISPIAVITVSTLVQVASEQSTGAVSAPSAETSPSTIDSIPPNALIAYRGLETSTSAPGGATVLLDLGGALLLHPPASAVPVAVAPATTAVTGQPSAAVAAAAPAAPAAPASAAPSTVTASVDTVTPEQRAAWERVAMCEEGGDWNVNGGEFSGGLGISRANWDAYGGTQFAGEGADATEDQQIMVAERIQSYPPDQDGCRGW
jgi:hypothetical protein